MPGLSGERLRARREEAGLSVRGLARGVGVSASLVSKIELGQSAPSLATLYAIVTELGISFDDLFFDPREAHSDFDWGVQREPATTGAWRAPSDGPVLRSDNRPVLESATGVRLQRLTAKHQAWLEFAYSTFAIGGESCPRERLATHTGSEYGVVLEGRCGATVGDKEYELREGDSIAFDSRTPHRIWNLCPNSTMVAIWAVVGRGTDGPVRHPGVGDRGPAEAGSHALLHSGRRGRAGLGRQIR